MRDRVGRLRAWTPSAATYPTATRAGGPAAGRATPITAELVRGALELERTAQGVLPHRLPAWARAQIPDDQLAMAEAQPSGVRLAFRTAATAVELDVVPDQERLRGRAAPPDGIYDLLVDGRLAGRATAPGGNVRSMDMRTGSVETRPGPVGTVRFTALPAGAKDVEIWLPHNEITELVALRTDAPPRPCPPRTPGVAAPRQLDQPRLRRREPHHDLARAGRGAGVWTWSTSGSGAARCSTRSPRATLRDTPGRPDQRQDRHQPRQHRPDAAARLRSGGARLPRHDPRGAPDHAAAGRLAPAVPDPRGHPRARRAGPRQARGGQAELRGHGRPGGPHAG